MANLQGEVFEAFRSINVPEDLALKAAGALAKRDDDVASLKSDVLLMKWMLGFVLTFQIAFAFSLVATWIKIGEINGQVLAMSAQINSQSAQINSQSAQINSQSAQINSMSAQINSQSAQITSLSAQIAALSAKIH